MNADDGPVTEELGKCAQRKAVIGIVKCGDKHCGVGDVEIRITRGDALASCCFEFTRILTISPGTIRRTISP